MAWKGPEPVGSVVGAQKELTIGECYRGLVNSLDASEWPDMPFRVLRLATREEWIASNPGRATHRLHSKIVKYYLVSTD